MELVVYGA